MDTLGLIHSLVVLEGNIQDRNGAKLLLWPVKNTLRCELEIVKRSETGFKILPHRWIVERTFGWLNHSRLLAKEYEKFLESSKTDIYLTLSRCMLKRLAPV